MRISWLTIATAPGILFSIAAASPQEARVVPSDRDPVRREVPRQTAGLSTVMPRSADDLFQRLPAALEHTEDRALIRLLASSEVAVSLDGDTPRRLGPDQAFYVLQDHFAAARLSPKHRLGVDGYHSPSGKIVCVPMASGDGDTQDAVLHFLTDQAGGPAHQRVWVQARNVTSGSPLTRGWRVVEFRVLD